MARKDRRPRGRRSSPAGPRPRAGARGGRSPAAPRREPDLLAEVRDRLATGEPLDLLAQASSLLAALDPRARSLLERSGAPRSPTPSLEDFVRSFAEVDRMETSALLAAVTALAPDELLRARARRALSARGHALPGWLRRLGQVRLAGVVEMVHVLGDGENLVVHLQLPGDHGAVHDLSVVAYVDHNLGTVVKDAFVVPTPLGELLAVLGSSVDDDEDTTCRALDPAEARARITQAVERGARTLPPLETDTWPACRPILEWAARLLPEGGTGYTRPAWGPADTVALREAFFASPAGRGLDDEDHRALFDSLVWFATDYGPGDALRWSPVSVEILLADWIPRKILADAEFLAKAPELLRAVVRYAHRERGIRSALTTQTIAAVDAWEPEYQRIIRSPRLQGPAALLAAMGAFDADAPGVISQGVAEALEALGLQALELLRRAVGGAPALQALDDHPLPDEEFDWEPVPLDVRDRVGEVLDLCDRCCEELLDAEYRTACRRLLARIAAGDAEVFRRRGRPDTAAAAICWTVGQANGLFGPAAGRLRVRDLLAAFGIAASSVSQRAATLLAAAGLAGRGYGLDGVLLVGTPELLTSARRRWLIEQRDRWTARGAPGGSTADAWRSPGP